MDGEFEKNGGAVGRGNGCSVDFLDCECGRFDFRDARAVGGFVN